MLLDGGLESLEIKKILGAPHAHQISGLGLRQGLIYYFHHLVHLMSWFTYRKAADGITRKFKIYQCSGGISPDVRINDALNDAE